MMEPVFKKRTTLNSILLGIFLIIDVVFVYGVYASLFDRYTTAITKHQLFIDTATFYWSSLAALFLAFALFTAIVIRKFPRENLAAALTLISSIVSFIIIFFSTGNIVDTIYIYSLIECIGLLAGFELTLLVPAFIRDEFQEKKKRTYRSVLPMFIVVFLMMLLIEFERYSFAVYSNVSQITTLTVGAWIATQLPVVLQRSRDAYKYYSGNYEREKLKMIDQSYPRSSERNRNLVE